MLYKESSKEGDECVMEGSPGGGGAHVVEAGEAHMGGMGRGE